MIRTTTVFVKEERLEEKRENNPKNVNHVSNQSITQFPTETREIPTQNGIVNLKSGSVCKIFVVPENW